VCNQIKQNIECTKLKRTVKELDIKYADYSNDNITSYNDDSDVYLYITTT